MAYFVFYSQLLPLTLILVLKMSAYYICCVYSRTTTCTTFYYGSNTMNPDQTKGRSIFQRKVSGIRKGQLLEMLLKMKSLFTKTFKSINIEIETWNKS